MDALETESLESKTEALDTKLSIKLEDCNKLKKENELLKRAIHMHGAHMGMCVQYHNRGGIAGPGEWEDLK